jgi:predicted transcriptional regulator
MSELQHNQKDTLPTSHTADAVLTGNEFFVLAKRAEKIMTALYMVTSFIDERDPLQNTIRHSVNDLVSDIFECACADEGQRSALVQASLIQGEKIISFLTTAWRTGLVSEMNFNIIHKEMKLLQSALYREQTLGGSVDTHVNDHSSKIYHARLQEIFKESYEKSPEVTSTENDIKDIKKPSPQKTSVSVAKESKATPVQPQRQAKPRRGESAKRRELILDIIKEKKNANMKDIATRITNCTEKTLQRDLLALIKDNLIEKKGEKRWSTYVLK